MSTILLSVNPIVWKALLAENERLRAALRKIDALNDNPARFSSEINAVIEAALGEQ